MNWSQENCLIDNHRYDPRAMGMGIRSEDRLCVLLFARQKPVGKTLFCCFPVRARRMAGFFMLGF